MLYTCNLYNNHIKKRMFSPPPPQPRRHDSPFVLKYSEHILSFSYRLYVLFAKLCVPEKLGWWCTYLSLSVTPCAVYVKHSLHKICTDVRLMTY